MFSGDSWGKEEPSRKIGNNETPLGIYTGARAEKSPSGWWLLYMEWWLNDQFASRWRRDKEMRNAFKIFQFILIIPSLVVLWPECGWQPVSLTNMITAASVKKVYRKATLCIHPDKAQQKGANLQQKYIAEKVFNLLKVLLSDI
ncbi:Auxilin-related protein 1 [Vitis vinifera]|uniref:Auxilin-related protein 1 n=1 Tax=Vitis vinifera TaxID=29760 RepID=A0A438G5H4_VITVI|nr:Auxilin-related protein 1 [Vitis vinifera]